MTGFIIVLTVVIILFTITTIMLFTKVDRLKTRLQLTEQLVEHISLNCIDMIEDLYPQSQQSESVAGYVRALNFVESTYIQQILNFIKRPL